MKRFLIFCDSKWRDLPTCYLLKKELENRYKNSVVLIVNFLDAENIVKHFSPTAIFIPHVNGNRNKNIAKLVRASGGFVFVLPTEGRPHKLEGAEWLTANSDYFDLFFSWCDLPNKLKNELGDKFHIVGCGRFNLNKLKITDKTTFCTNHNVNPDNPIVLFNSSFPAAKFALKNLAFHLHDMEDLGAKKINGDPELDAVNSYDRFLRFQTWITETRLNFPKITFMVKPHPMEDISLWERFCLTNNIILIKGDFVYNPINAADVIISQVGCVTHQDAWLQNKPSIHLDLNTPKTDFISETEKYGYGIADDPALLSKMLQQCLLEEEYNSNKDKEILNQYGFTIQDSSSKILDIVDEYLATMPQSNSEFNLPKTFELIRNVDKNVPTIDWLGHYNKLITQKDVIEFE